MIKKPYTFYDDLVVVGSHRWLIQGDEIPLPVVIIPPLGFFLGGLAVFFIDLWSYYDDWKLYDMGLYFGDGEPTFNPTSLVISIVMASIAIILFTFFMFLRGNIEKGNIEKIAIRYSFLRMHFVFGARGKAEMPVIPTYCVRHIQVTCGYHRDSHGNKIPDQYSRGHIEITYIDENNKTKKYKIKNIDQAMVTGKKMLAIVQGGIFE